MKLANNVNISQLSKVGNGVGATTTMCKKVAGVVGTIVAFLHNITRSTKKKQAAKTKPQILCPTHTLRHTILEKTVDEKLPQHHHCHWKLMPTLLQVLLDVAGGGAAAGDDGGGGELLVLATLARKHFNLIDIAT